jgi:sugar phosphate isomerase/epimerase
VTALLIGYRQMKLRRRTLLAAPLAALASRLRAAAPRLRLGYDTYSLRAWNMKAMEHLEFAARHGCTALQISSLGDFESLEESHLRRVRARAEELGIALDAGTGCICPSARAWRNRGETPEQHLRRALRVAQLIGARTLRCYLGDFEDRLHPDGIEFHMENTIRVLRSVRDAALEAGVKIALENHSGDLQAWECRAVVEEAGTDAVGACLDTGNPIWCAEHPEVTLEVLGPVAVTTHVRDTAIFPHPRGCAAHWTALGDGSIDLVRLAELQKKLCPEAALHLEIITGRPPRVVPFYEDGFWKAFPKARAAELARFIALVKQGSPLMKPMVIEDVPGMDVPEYRAALKKHRQLRGNAQSLVHGLHLAARVEKGQRAASHGLKDPTQLLRERIVIGMLAAAPSSHRGIWDGALRRQVQSGLRSEVERRRKNLLKVRLEAGLRTKEPEVTVQRQRSGDAHRASARPKEVHQRLGQVDRVQSRCRRFGIRGNVRDRHAVRIEERPATGRRFPQHHAVGIRHLLRLVQNV